MNRIVRAAIVTGGAVLLLNAVFFLLSSAYFNSKNNMMSVYTEADVNLARLGFVIFTVTVGIAVVCANISTFMTGHALMGIMAVMSLVAGIAAATHDLPGVLAATELVIGAVLVLLVILSMQGSRAAWAFLIAIAAVYTIVFFFGSPKIRNVLGTELWMTMPLPGLNAVALASLILCRQRYRN